MSIQIEKYRQKRAHKDIIVGLRYSPTGRFLVSADRSGEIIVWPQGDPRGAQLVCSPYAPLTGVWFSEDEKWLLAGYQGGHLLVYGFPKIKLEAEVRLKPDRPEGYILSGTSRPVLNWVVLAVCPSNDSNIYAVLEFRDFFTIQRETLQVTNYVHRPGPLLECTAAPLNGRFVFFGDDLGYIYRLQLPGMKLEPYAEHHEQVPAFDLAMRPTTKDAPTGIAGLALSCDGKLLASTSRTGGVQIWQTEVSCSTFQLQPFAAREPVRTDWLRGVCFLPNSTTLALGADEGTVEVWDYQSKQGTHVAKCPASVRSLDVSPNGSQLAIGCEDGSIFLIPWNESYHQKASEKAL